MPTDPFVINNAANIRKKLNVVTWGTVTLASGIRQLICPLCMSVIPAVFDNANELPSYMTPKYNHIEYHALIAESLQRR